MCPFNDSFWKLIVNKVAFFWGILRVNDLWLHHSGKWKTQETSSKPWAPTFPPNCFWTLPLIRAGRRWIPMWGPADERHECEFWVVSWVCSLCLRLSVCINIAWRETLVGPGCSLCVCVCVCVCVCFGRRGHSVQIVFMRRLQRSVVWLIYGFIPPVILQGTGRWNHPQTHTHAHTHTHTHTLNNAEGLIAVAGVLNELCEEGIYGQLFT